MLPKSGSSKEVVTSEVYNIFDCQVGPPCGGGLPLQVGLSHWGSLIADLTVYQFRFGHAYWYHM